MENEKRRKLNELAMWMSRQYEYSHLAGRQDVYLAVMMHDGQDQFFIEPDEVAQHFQYLDKMFRCYSVGLYPMSPNYDF